MAPCFPIAATDIAGLLDLARDEAVDLTVVGPEAPLELGLVGHLRSPKGSPSSGRRAAAARLETSKAFAKHLMALAGVPTARYRVAATPDEAHAASTSWAARSRSRPTGSPAAKASSSPRTPRTRWPRSTR